MSNNIIKNHSSLSTQIDQLSERKILEEKQLKQSLMVLSTNLTPVAIIKNSLHELAADTEIKTDLLKVGINIGATLIINRLTQKDSTFKGMFYNFAVNQLSGLIIKHPLAKSILSSV
jgi:hypothetical protein